jgi:aspartyl-tRNA(Asn)/glutamyl-tRNA(Gln) amidotransferase subunit B
MEEKRINKNIYKPVIGLEIHAELNTKNKMFCSCLNNPDEKKPNVNICPVCTAQPGTLPVINREAVAKVIKTGLALKCRISECSKFDRKNYFYPDLPKGYQISQYDEPLCLGGSLKIDGREVNITRIHLEEDTGRLIHPQAADYSLVDFNRAGIPLMELVTEPDIASGKEARKFGEELQLILRYLGVSDADMEKGQMRVEVNISLGQGGKLGTKVEIKNLNSFRSVEKAVEYEIIRQKKILEKGGKIVQETRGWLDAEEVTVSQREKEEAHDYRYFPEPDLPPLYFSQDFIKGIENEMPELPQSRRERFEKEYGLSSREIEILVLNKPLGEYFEKVILGLKPDSFLKERSIKLAANYLITDLQGLLKESASTLAGLSITPEDFAEFISLICQGKISSKIAKMLLLKMHESGGHPSEIIKRDNLIQITDVAEIEKIIDKVIKDNAKAMEDYKKGKETAFQYLIGKIMAESKGKADPQEIGKLLKRILTKSN